MDTSHNLIAYNKRKNRQLIISIALDVLGMSSMVVPAIGGITDAVFAPIYGFAIFLMYKRKMTSAAVGGIFGLVEELLPWSDIFPTATVMWLYTYVINKDETLHSFKK